MKESSAQESKKSTNIKVCGQPITTRCGPKEVKKYRSGKPAWNALTLQHLVERAKALNVDGLTIFPETVRKSGGGYFYVLTECRCCGKREEKELRNMEKGFSSKCRCKRLGTRAGYGIPAELVKTLGTRYSAMVQRCHRDTHVSVANYKGRGIQVLFKDRRAFVTWALETWPGENFKGKDFDRTDNNGHYSKENLRLVDRSTNLLNRRNQNPVNIGTAREFMRLNPDVRLTEATVLRLLKKGTTETGIMEISRKSPRAGLRKSRSTTF
jgi:hypothetical protein